MKVVSQRSVDKTLKMIVRDLKLPMDKNTKAMWVFVWWINMGEDAGDQERDCDNRKEDIDLPTAIFDENIIR